MEELLKMLAKKKDHGQMSDDDKQAKLDVIKELIGMADGEMGSRIKGGLDGMNKVTVAAPDKESLSMGLDKAEELLGSDLDGDEEKGEDDDHVEKVLGAKDESEDGNPSPSDDVMASLPSEDSAEEDESPFNKKRAMMMAKK